MRSFVLIYGIAGVWFCSDILILLAVVEDLLV